MCARVETGNAKLSLSIEYLVLSSRDVQNLPPRNVYFAFEFGLKIRQRIISSFANECKSHLATFWVDFRWGVGSILQNELRWKFCRTPNFAFCEWRHPCIKLKVHNQCDQANYWTLGKLLKPLATINLPKDTKIGSGCGSVGSAVASDIRGPRFNSSHRQNLYWIFVCLLVYYQPYLKDDNK